MDFGSFFPKGQSLRFIPSPLCSAPIGRGDGDESARAGNFLTSCLASIAKSDMEAPFERVNLKINIIYLHRRLLKYFTHIFVIVNIIFNILISNLIFLK
jgi:hypothetical protein